MNFVTAGLRKKEWNLEDIDWIHVFKTDFSDAKYETYVFWKLMNFTSLLKNSVFEVGLAWIVPMFLSISI